MTARPTGDIDFINEVPFEIREQRETLSRIEKKYGLTLGHVQSHYLPNNWQARRSPAGAAGVVGNYSRETGGTFDPNINQSGGPGYGLASG